MGYHPQFTDIQPRGTNNPTVEERIKLLERMREEINASSCIAAEMVQNYARTSIPEFKKGDKVWLEEKKHHHHAPISETGLKTTQTFCNRRHVGISNSKTLSLTPMENSPRIPHFPSHPIQVYTRTRNTLPETTS